MSNPNDYSFATTLAELDAGLLPLIGRARRRNPPIPTPEPARTAWGDR